VSPSPRSVTISGRLAINMHSLNNEGGEGNQIQTRMVHIVDGAGNLQVVNAISGDMLKHIQAEHFWSLASNGNPALPLCTGCAKLSANRINDDEGFFKGLGKANQNIVDQMIVRCAMDDVEGILITRDNRSTPRKSTVEFGWAIGLPDQTRTESYFHVKYVAERGSGSGDESGANVGQNIFYRPASSGLYAVVCTVELHRVSWNDISRQHVKDVADDARRTRQRALLQSVLYTLVRTNGAQRNTQHPHILGFQGVVSWSTTATPAPTVSALANDYQEQMRAIGQELNRLDPGAVTSEKVDSSAELAHVLADLVERI